jgi:hypothetical protein
MLVGLLSRQPFQRNLQFVMCPTSNIFLFEPTSFTTIIQPYFGQQRVGLHNFDYDWKLYGWLTGSCIRFPFCPSNFVWIISWCLNFQYTNDVKLGIYQRTPSWIQTLVEEPTMHTINLGRWMPNWGNGISGREYASFVKKGKVLRGPSARLRNKQLRTWYRKQDSKNSLR